MSAFLPRITTLQSVIEACARGRIPGRVVVVLAQIAQGQIAVGEWFERCAPEKGE